MSDQPKSEVFRFRMSRHYRQKLRAYAAKQGLSESQVMRDYVRRLPDLTKKNVEYVEEK